MIGLEAVAMNDERQVIVDRYGVRWLPVTDSSGEQFYLPGRLADPDEIRSPEWEWPGYPDRSFEKRRLRRLAQAVAE
jgi:hypothetical protein